MNKLNPNAQKWVQALRYGEYKQATGALQKAEGYCCLGVAADLYENHTGDMLPRRDDKLFDGNDINDELAGPFDVVREWLGLRTGSGAFSEYNGDYDTLIGLNDAGAAFEDIARIIEEKPNGLFMAGR